MRSERGKGQVVQAELIHGDHVAVSAAAGLIRGHEQIGEGPLQEFLLILTGLAGSQNRLFNVFAGGTW